MTYSEIELIESEEGCLPVEPGLGALAELRRVKWFQHVGLKTPFLPDITRLFRGLTIKEPSWRALRILCPWTISLIIEHVVQYELGINEGEPTSISPARIFKYVLETIAD